MTETNDNDYNLGYDEDAELEDGEKYVHMDQSEIDELLADEKYEILLYDIMNDKNYEIPLDETNTTLKTNRITLLKMV